MLPWDDAATGSTEIEQLVYLSNLIGQDPTLVQPGGGNTSVKIEETDVFGRSVEALAVKGSGTDLRTITEPGFTYLYRDRLATLREREEMSDEGMMELMRSCMLYPDRDPVPSVETPLHSLIPARFIAHTHDIATLSLTDTPSAREHSERLFGADAAFLEYVRPGFPLAKRLAERYGDGLPEGAVALVMEKHGLAAWGETAKECYENLASVITRATEYVADQRAGKRVFGPRTTDDLPPDERRTVAATIAPVIRSELVRRGWPCVLAFDDSDQTLDHTASESFPDVASRGVMTPEHIMRAGRRALVLDLNRGSGFNLTDGEAGDNVRNLINAAHEEYVAYAARNGHPEPIPDWLKVIAVPGAGAFYAGKDRRNALTAGECYRATMEVMAGAEAVERFETLSAADACEMEYWPLERRKIEESARSRKDLDAKIALIIGGASGIGAATARRFAAEGAHVAVADLDADHAKAVAGELPAERGHPLAVDAGDPASVEAAVQETVLKFGGIDVLFYSPGVAPRLHGVSEMADEEIEKQLRVHYQGAVAATRAASQVMLAQGTGGRLIYNASKAAFAPGEGAAAYGASKAALVHYVRNVANELSRHGITANYINADAIDTPLFRTLVQQRGSDTGKTEEETLARYAERSIFRTATVPPEAVAEAALWLASDRSAHTSGCVITVGGGAEGMPR